MYNEIHKGGRNMKDFYLVNTFFNIVYHNENAVIHDITSTYQYTQKFREWLKQHHIECPILDHIHQDNFTKFCKEIFMAEENSHIYNAFLKDMNHISDQFQDKTFVFYIPGLHGQKIQDVPLQRYDNVYLLGLSQPFLEDGLSFYDPFPAFFCAMNHADLWPGVLIFNNKQQIFTSIQNEVEWNELIRHIENHDNLFDIYNDYQDDSYYIHLSDLHLGTNRKHKGVVQLYCTLDQIVPYLKSHEQLKILITGDIMDSPNRKNMYIANDFMNNLKKIYKADVTFILGNHDVIVHGFNFARRQKSKVVAYLLGENIKVLEKEKMIFIKMDTTSAGNLARGMVGKRQLDEIDDELMAIENLEDYTMLIMLHHHVYPISKADFIKTKWHERTFIHRIMEKSKVLVDAAAVIDWIEKRNIHYILHGHKHLPFFRKENNQYYISAGSATGGLKESQSRYISFNVMKYNLKEKAMKTCMIVYSDKSRMERQRVEVYLFH